MNNENIKVFTLEEIKELFWSFFLHINRYRNILIISLVLGLVGGLSLSWVLKPKYQAKVTFLINESKGQTFGGLSALAGQLGISSTGPGMSDDRILFLGNSRQVLGQALLYKDRDGVIIANKLLDFYQLTSWKNDTFMLGFSGIRETQLQKLSKQENYALDVLMKLIREANIYKIESIKKKSSNFVGNTSSGIIEVSFMHKLESVPLVLVNAVYLELSRFYSQAITKSALNNYILVSSRADSVYNELVNAENQSSVAADDARSIIKYKGRIDEVRLRRKVELLSLIYAEVIKNREIAKFNLEQEKPGFEVIDYPTEPLEKIEKSKVLLASLGAFFLFGLVFFGLTLYFFIQKSSKK